MSFDTESVAIKFQTDRWHSKPLSDWLLAPKMGGWPDHVNATRLQAHDAEIADQPCIGCQLKIPFAVILQGSTCHLPTCTVCVYCVGLAWEKICIDWNWTNQTGDYGPTLSESSCNIVLNFAKFISDLIFLVSMTDYSLPHWNQCVWWIVWPPGLLTQKVNVRTYSER